MARSMPRWIWTRSTRSWKRRAAGLSNRRSKNRSTAVNGPAIRWPSLAGARPAAGLGPYVAARGTERWLPPSTAVGDALAMQGVNVFCERCGSLQPRPETSTARSAGVLARRVLDAVGITESQAQPGDDWLRLCLNCRGYSCPACWNPADGVCQTCAPLPEPVQVVSPEPVHVTVTEPNPAPVAAEPEPVAVAEQIAEPEPVAVA